MAARLVSLLLAPDISVAILPGATTFTVIPCGVRSGTSERASPERAAFETTYAEPAILGTARPAREPTNTIRPNFSATMPGTTAWQHSIAPVKLTASTSFHSLSVRVWKGVGPFGPLGETPALQMRISGVRQQLRRSSKKVVISAGAAKSVIRANRRSEPKSDDNIWTALSTLADRWPKMATRWPRARRYRAVASPIPEVPPVTTATLCASRVLTPLRPF